MKFRTRTSIAAVAVASVIGGGVAGAVLTAPAAALAQETGVEDDGTVIADGFQTLEDVLSELVDEGVITQEQADAVGERLQEARPQRGFRGMGHGPIGGALEDVAEVLGLTVEDLSAALMDGSSLADAAAESNVDVQDVIDVLVAQAQEHLDQAVADGRLTADEATERAAEIETRITDMVNGDVDFGGRRGFGHRGHGPRAFDGSANDGDVTEDAASNV